MNNLLHPVNKYLKSIVFVFFSVVYITYADCQVTVTSYDTYPVYTGLDLGVQYKPSSTHFKIWAPQASEVILRLYKTGDSKDSIALNVFSMIKSIAGTWSLSVDRDIKNSYYTFQVKQDDKWLTEGPDIYAKAVGVNGKRGMVVNMRETNPPGWDMDKHPFLKNYTDIVLYETHIRDISISKNSGINHKGKYLGITERGTKGPAGVSTGLDHLKELGITHIHILPAFDFRSVDESTPELKRYNWGYDPVNYNVPEGSYATDPYDGRIRIREFKEMVQSLHSNGMRVILDVVYNHTGGLEAPFNRFAPGYFYRHNANGTYSNGTGTGNETASERPMMRKFMIESVLYWMKEYHLDGFRFDLMGNHDIETMNQLSEAVHAIYPTAFIYGEGWTAGKTPLPTNEQSVKSAAYKLNKIAVFSDDIRDGLRGLVSNPKAKGFVSGATGFAETIKFAVVGATQHPQIQYDKSRSKMPWAKEPYQSINYASCHDDATLFDRLTETNPGSSVDEIIKMDKLAQTVVFTSQGVPFLHSGAEMLRTKYGVHNSYRSADSINEIDWNRKVQYAGVFDYYKRLISLRKNHPAFRLPNTGMIQHHLKFIDTAGDSLFVAYQITDVKDDKWKNILVLLNGSKNEKQMQLPLGTWILAVDGESINNKGIRKLSGAIIIPSTVAYVLFKENSQ
ncbi:MAG: pulA [Chitinophagaceae bacterium]|nr:pulA [Chitinophagaceae bacterium]